MFARCASAKVFVLLIILLSTKPLLAMEHSEAALNSLLYQVQFVRLIKPSTQIEQDYRALTLGAMELKLARVQRIQSELEQFWASLGVPTNAMNLKGSDNLFQQVLSLEPISKDYLATSNKIRYLLWLEQKGDWSELVSNSWLKLGDKHNLVSEISRRLKGFGDLREYNPVNTLFDANVENGVRHFQQRHGLKLDGIIGPETLRWINIKPVKRAELLAINFINKTSYLASIEPSFLIINIPAFELELIDNGQVALQSRVIVGKPYRQTPLLSSRISNLVINPSWRVPRRLLTRDLLPKVREDGGYIRARNFNVFDSQGLLVSKTAQEWQDLAHGRFPYRLVQKPGKENTLGRYKFYFENKYSVYLHDTADKALFEESNRALSSGCIRIENVEGLANWMASNLVTDKQTWVDMQIERQKTQWFSLDQSLPVHLVYWTAWVDKLGVAQFRNDIYHKNSTLNSASAHLSP
ncbi:putative peptidoglycan binding protein,Ykud domain-containing protein [Shewanella psychrophila]|uniref:Putative peptidoglycan binding protein,Ykud domain-containing protein n=1 Tax=Shewanella psychrophila TaxID=225848 RepID=A0A1S6HJW6_9GAMM|nr:L,D-transpeptidase family protein [Shewanella psychrophila]AQS35810.1 putative peptidoglycan binding protein,Ykud domain-containing protein [Shewanella psychrophila]